MDGSEADVSESQPRRGRVARVGVVVIAAIIVAASAQGAAGTGSTGSLPDERPWLGVNLIQYRFDPPNCWGSHILLDYHFPGVRSEVVGALHAMRAAGVETLRLQLIHMHGTKQWIPSDGGRIREPYRTNLVRLLSDIRAAHFKQVTIQFGPRGPNEPSGWSEPDLGPYDPALFDENWGFIRDVRSLVKTNGPDSARFDLYGEGAPGDWDLANKPWWGDYLTRLYRNYVDAFGNADVTVSAIAKGMENYGNTQDDVERLQNLIDVLRASGRPLPTWFAVHPSWDARAIDDLRAVDAVLSRNGLEQPLVISESRYENAVVAGTIAEFVRSGLRPVLEVMSWPQYGVSTAAQPKCATLPYRIDEYARAVRGQPAARALRGSVSKSGTSSLLTAFGHRVVALPAGSYTVTVRDTSARHSFVLTGPAVQRSTGARFTGTRRWTAKLRHGVHRFTVMGPAGSRRHFEVVAPGG